MVIVQVPGIYIWQYIRGIDMISKCMEALGKMKYVHTKVLPRYKFQNLEGGGLTNPSTPVVIPSPSALVTEDNLHSWLYWTRLVYIAIGSWSPDHYIL